MDSFEAGDIEYRNWERGTIRSRSKLIGYAPDPITGQEVEVYGFLDDEFAGTRLNVSGDNPKPENFDRWP